MIRDKKKGILFWITGLSGSGKTTISKEIHSYIEKNYGPTLLFSGDDLRKIFCLKGHSKTERLKILKSYCKFAKHITDNKINILFAVVGMFNAPRKWNKKNIKNYCEIYIQTDLKKIIKLGKKKIYQNKKINNIMGVDIEPEFPKRSNIILVNNFDYSIKILAKNLIKKIRKEIR